MPGKGPPPKDPKIRQRQNKKPTNSQLPAEGVDQEAPPLQGADGREFHPMTQSWWERVWTSPMAAEYLPTDEDGLMRLALLVDDFHKAEESKQRRELMVEIRLQEARFGLSPVDRSRLQWEVQKGEEAKSKREPKQPSRPSKSGDPRQNLSAIK